MEGRDAIPCKSSRHRKTQHVVLGTTREGRTQQSKVVLCIHVSAVTEENNQISRYNEAKMIDQFISQEFGIKTLRGGVDEPWGTKLRGPMDSELKSAWHLEVRGEPRSWVSPNHSS